jgi:glycosyltransferase involved in cell wall biosynthesis
VEAVHYFDSWKNKFLPLPLKIRSGYWVNGKMSWNYWQLPTPLYCPGLPMALLEAMMAGLPVIATRVQGVEEVIENGVQGFLVPLENSEELSKAILQLLSNPDQSRKMGIAASSRIMQGYTTDQMCEKYLQVIMRLVHKIPRQ